MRVTVLILSCILAVNGQLQSPNALDANLISPLHNELSERIGNVSLELLYFTSRAESQNQNLIVSPITAWTVMAVIAEGAEANTLFEINRAFRLYRDKSYVRNGFKNVAQYLLVNTSTIELSKFNALFVDKELLPERDFMSLAREYYDTRMVPVAFTQTVEAAKQINDGISKFTHGRITKIVEPGDFNAAQMFLVSAVYFKGQWTAPFNASSTVQMPFYNSMGQQIGKVNMMYNRYTYPFSNIRELQARVIEIPYGKENRLSMLVMLPHPNVTLDSMFRNFMRVPLDRLFKELRVAQEEYEEDEVDCFIPRFKIESDLKLTEIFKEMGIRDLFDMSRARLDHMSRMPMYVTKVIHKAEIEVTEEGTTASGVTSAEFANRIGVARFEANRPFTYLIVEKLTNTIVFGGIYRVPSLY